MEAQSACAARGTTHKNTSQNQVHVRTRSRAYHGAPPHLPQGFARARARYGASSPWPATKYFTSRHVPCTSLLPVRVTKLGWVGVVASAVLAALLLPACRTTTVGLDEGPREYV